MRRVTVEGNVSVQLHDGWQAAATSAGADADPTRLDGLQWQPARVPGTAAGSMRDAGLWCPGQYADLDSQDWWFRTRFRTEPIADGEEVVLRLGGIATIADVFLGGKCVLHSDSMFATHTVDVGGWIQAENELTICCRALGPRLQVRRHPRARWRTRLVKDGHIRFFRTMLIGHLVGVAPVPPVVGPWRSVVLERRRVLVVEELKLSARVKSGNGVIAIGARLRGARGGAPPDRIVAEVRGCNGTHHAELTLTPTTDGVAAEGELIVPDAELWWPHTHGRPTLHEVRLRVAVGGEEIAVDAGGVGFRTLEPAGELERDGVQLCINGIRVFARGAVWTPLHGAVAPPSGAELRRVLESVAAAGMNMLRVPGTGAYESELFYDLCDELGILVWQDFMFANLDYPESDSSFMESVEREVQDVLGSFGGRPSLAVLCGSSEVAQQVAMLGLDPALANGPLFGELLPSLVSDAGLDAVYVPSAPWGGELPFRSDRGVANYYGVGGYRRGLEDVRRSEVRFAAECLAFSNVPDEEAIDRLEQMVVGGLGVHHPRWKAGVPRDPGAGWDFEDVRDHYLAELFVLDPGELRRTDHERYLELSRAVTGEIMAEVFGEWRREASPCGGGLVLWLSDLVPGAGWGLLDDRGRPKVAYHHVRRALAPIAVWNTDEGLGGIDAHVANDTPRPLRARLRVAMYRDFELPVGHGVMDLELAPHCACTRNVETVLGRFVDAAWAYRFGPPAQNLIVLSLERDTGDGVELLSQSFRLPAGRPLTRESPPRLGLTASASALDDGALRLDVRSHCFAYGVRVHLPGFALDDDAFSVEPGGERVLQARRIAAEAMNAVGVTAPAVASVTALTGASVTALNLAGRIPINRKDA